MADDEMKHEDEQYDVQDPDAGGNDEVRPLKVLRCTSKLHHRLQCLEIMWTLTSSICCSI